jgi:hypothetical protein
MAETKNFILLILLPSESSSICQYESSRTETAVLRTCCNCCAPAATAAHLLQLLCKAASANRLAERFAASTSGCIHASADVSIRQRMLTTCPARCGQQQRMYQAA